MMALPCKEAFSKLISNRNTHKDASTYLFDVLSQLVHLKRGHTNRDKMQEYMNNKETRLDTYE